MARAHKPTARRPFLSVWLLLALIALLPMTGLMYFAQGTFQRIADIEDRSILLEQDLTVIAALQGMRIAVGPVVATESIEADLAPLGLTLADAVRLSGRDEPFVVESEGQQIGVPDYNRALFDAEAQEFRAVVRQMPGETSKEFEAIIDALDGVDDLRARIANASVTSSEVRAFYSDLQDSLDRESEILEGTTLNRVGQDGMVAASTGYLHAFIGLSDGLVAATAELDLASALLEQTPGRVPTPDAAVRLVAAVEIQNVGFSRFVANGPGPAVEVYEEVNRSAEVRQYRRVQSELLGSISLEGFGVENGNAADDASLRDPLDPLRGIDFLNAAFSRLVLLIDLPEMVSESAFDAIQDGRASSQQELRRTQAVTVAVFLATVLLAGWAAFMIGRPLRRIQARAESISAGELSDEPLGSLGPREIATLSTTLDTLSANLRMVDAQTSALASGDTESEAFLSEPPGPIGVSLKRTLVQLNSMTSALVKQAGTDSLTGLANRSTVIGLLRDRYEEAPDNIGLLCIDLDRFKIVNDTYGHRTGDGLLAAVSAAMQDVVGDAGVVGRLGGDEFVVVLSQGLDLAMAKELASELVATISKPVDLYMQTVQVGASVGVAFSSWGYRDPSALLHAADLALYTAKGSDQVCAVAQEFRSDGAELNHT